MPTIADPDYPLDRLYALLPMAIQTADSEQGEPLRALLQVITEQANLLESDLVQLYDNWFVETCEPWVLPYVADLIGHRPIAALGEAGQDPAALARNAILLGRREVAQTLRYRRRKGTLALLEQLARDVGGWPARAVERQRLLSQTVSLRLGQPGRSAGVDLRDGAALRRLGGPFDSLPHTPDLRRLASTRTQGLHTPAGVGVFLWRLKSYPVTLAPATPLERGARNLYTFSVLGNDTPLFNRARPGDAAGCAPTGLLQVPHAIGRAEFSAPHQPGAGFATASTEYYGLAPGDGSGREAQSVAIWAPGWPDHKDPADQQVPAARVISADLDGWNYQPPENHVAVDPVRGRIAFPLHQLPKRVWVSYRYGFSADMGGGEYRRTLRQHEGARVERVTGVKALKKALEHWRDASEGNNEPQAPADQPVHAVIELGDSGVYELEVDILLAAGHTLQLRAAQRTRPVLRLTHGMLIAGGAGSRFTIDGLMVAGRGLQLAGALASLTVRHSTLVPGWSLEPDCNPAQPVEPSIEVLDSGACIVIGHSIVGSIQVNNDEVRTDPVQLRISDSVVDATGADCDSPQCEAIGAAGSRLAFVQLRVERSTIFGRVMTHAIERADDTLFMGRISVARRQAGCMRFCYVTPGSRTPRRFQCQPDLAAAATERAGRDHADDDEAIEAARQEEQRRVRPVFDSVRYGTPAYCRLALACAPEIVRGAEDESEMGVFHDLYQPQRAANLRQRLDEFSPAGADSGIVYAT
ncbi:hypothetical protein AB2N08_03120 [Massilia aurea]|uniref:hypothetical protein n=1 Tax=Massilia aurea TaxID=373040 RepID=UPI003462E5F7